MGRYSQGAMVLLISLLNHFAGRHLLSGLQKHFKAPKCVFAPNAFVVSTELFPNKRADRFPSVEQRLKMYMSSWYLPPCTMEDQIEFWYDNATNPNLMVRLPFAEGFTTIRIDSSTAISRLLIHPTRDLINRCNTTYCIDTAKFLFSVLDKLYPPTMSIAPVVMQYGDAEPFQAMSMDSPVLVWYPHVPVVKKFRYAMTKEQLHKVTSNATCLTSPHRRVGNVADPTLRTQAIVSILNYNRHYAGLSKVPSVDIPWKLKTNMAVWRGTLTGTNRILRDSRSDEQWCRGIPRCQVVLEYGNSSLVNARLVDLKNETPPIARRLEGIEMYGKPLDMAQMLSYKMIIMVEGNDVSSGLKWALYSQSVVLMAPPSFTSWAMEELLVPWVHYIPINSTNVVERVEWVLTHDAEARRIAHFGHLWIHDLVYHEDATLENKLIVQETMRRMLVHWKYRSDFVSHDRSVVA